GMLRERLPAQSVSHLPAIANLRQPTSSPSRAFVTLRKSRFAHHLRHDEIKPSMSKGERISQFVRELEGDEVDPSGDVATHPFYRAFFRCWNEQRYYEAHDVLEQLWLNSDTE